MGSRGDGGRGGEGRRGFECFGGGGGVGSGGEWEEVEWKTCLPYRFLGKKSMKEGNRAGLWLMIGVGSTFLLGAGDRRLQTG